MYKNVEEVLGAGRTKRLRDLLLTKIDLYYENIDDEGARQSESVKVNTSLTGMVMVIRLVLKGQR